MAAEKLELQNYNDLAKNKKFNQGILVSIVAHVILVSSFLIKTTFFESPPIDLSQAIRVDMVGLPDKAKPNQLPAKIENILKEKEPAKEEPKPEEAKEKPVEPAKKEKVVLPKKEIKQDTETINLKKVKATQKSAVEKLKAQSAIEKIKQEMLNDSEKKPAVSAPIKGRIISAGSSLTGLD
ncbi:MAG: energy transducer TonB, partial [Pseudobdellovibrio sp.]